MIQYTRKTERFILNSCGEKNSPSLLKLISVTIILLLIVVLYLSGCLLCFVVTWFMFPVSCSSFTVQCIGGKVFLLFSRLKKHKNTCAQTDEGFSNFFSHTNCMRCWPGKLSSVVSQPIGIQLGKTMFAKVE